MPAHDKATIISMAVVVSVIASLLHEGLGHGVTAWLRGDVVTELTSNHLSSVRPDRLVHAGGTVVNLIAGTASMLAARRTKHSNRRYFLLLLGAVNLLMGTGYFLFSGVLGLGDWAEIIAGLPHQAILRTGMAVAGIVLYRYSVRVIAILLRPFVQRPADFNTVGRLPYYAACCFWCISGALDPLGFKLMLMSTIPASFGGLSGLMWADRLMPRSVPEEELVVSRSRIWWGTAIVVGLIFLLTIARGIEFSQGHA